MGDLKNIIEKIINDNRNKGIFHGAVSESMICEMEKRLSLPIPSDYRWYIKEYGGGGICTEVLGIPKTGRFLVVEKTEELKKRKLPEGLIVIENVGEFVYCLDTTRMDNENHCPVVTWSSFDNDGIIDRYNNFLEFIYDRFIEALDNWEEED